MSCGKFIKKLQAHGGFAEPLVVASEQHPWHPGPGSLSPSSLGPSPSCSGFSIPAAGTTAGVWRTLQGVARCPELGSGSRGL